ncbi:Zn-dependent M28 family amino/carboxypeptidase [Caulobacter ginsengisoli]|uniref:Zn-dependent M28 family amino/carboxypeptidase n=1 Tax=Caulobacter ginsengisoli TaxID=400775 RepID=A0ABU0IRI9_9CAUL|nr:M28 family peptidase [Caulobacter ginsengisoli]MDQ0463966.1 Zn-dependent M28 family amino/carboxypeptidase [Caulobacter ginsengisoli]
MIRFAALLSVLLLGAAPIQGARGLDFDANRLSEHVRILSSDQFEGRGPGQPGETKTVEYLAGQFATLGLEPGGPDGGWFQTVMLHRFTQDGTPSLSVSIAGRDWPIVYGNQALVGPQRAAGASVADAAMVFVGFGVHAPELGWDDYKGVDLRGKIAVMLANDPDFDATASGRFGGEAMSVHGDWTHKYLEVTRRGAVGMVWVHDTASAGFDWPALQGFWTSPQLDIVRPAAETDVAPITGWLRGDTAAALFAAAGLDLKTQSLRARSRSFQPVTLPRTRLSISYRVKREVRVSRNVIARLPGARHPGESVLYGAHWDHLGRGEPQADGDDIYNGALDNASGLAGLLELARLFAAGERPGRSIVFIAFTGEETGLLGSAWYAAHSAFPLETTAGGVNIDGLPIIAPSDMKVSFGLSDLQDILARASARQGRRILPPSPWKGGAYARSDHYSLAQAGLPMLFAGSRVAGRDYFEKRYHQPDDEWSPDWDWSGAIADLQLYRAVGLELANSRRWPRWWPGAEFGAIRDRSAAARR